MIVIYHESNYNILGKLAEKLKTKEKEVLLAELKRKKKRKEESEKELARLEKEKLERLNCLLDEVIALRTNGPLE